MLGGVFGRFHFTRSQSPIAATVGVWDVVISNALVGCAARSQWMWDYRGAVFPTPIRNWKDGAESFFLVGGKKACVCEGEAEK